MHTHPPTHPQRPQCSPTLSVCPSTHYIISQIFTNYIVTITAHHLPKLEYHMTHAAYASYSVAG